MSTGQIGSAATKADGLSSTTVRPRIAAPIPDPPELQQVHVGGSFIDGVQMIPRTNASLHLIPGRLHDEDDDKRRRVLLPFAEMRLDGLQVADLDNDQAHEPVKAATMFSANLPLENMAFVLLDLTSDLRRICLEACSLTAGDMPIDTARMAHVRYFVAHLERQARSCRVKLDQTFGVPEPVGES